jgi:hypothetical protein
MLPVAVPAAAAAAAAAHLVVGAAMPLDVTGHCAQATQ